MPIFLVCRGWGRTLATTPALKTPPTQTPDLSVTRESLRASVIAFESADWEFLSDNRHDIVHTHGPAFTEASSAALDVCGMFPPGFDPTVAVSLFRDASEGFPADSIQAASTQIISLRPFHAIARRRHT